MIWLWLLDAFTAVVGWVVSWFPSDWVIPYPEAGWQLLVPVPLGLSAGSLQTWATWGLLVAGALVTGRFLTWLYRLIPANG